MKWSCESYGRKLWSGTTDQFVRYLPRGAYGRPDEATARAPGGARAQGDCRTLEGGHPLPFVRGAEAAFRVEAAGAECEPESPGPAAPRDGGTRPHPPRDFPASAAAG